MSLRCPLGCVFGPSVKDTHFFTVQCFSLPFHLIIGADFMFLVPGQNAKGTGKHQDVDGVEWVVSAEVFPYSLLGGLMGSVVSSPSGRI